MFSALKNVIQNVVQKTIDVNDKFYGQVIDELSNGFKEKSALGRAIAQAHGDSKLVESLYVQIRALDLQIEYNKQVEAGKLQLKEVINSKNKIQTNYENNFYSEKFENILLLHGFNIMENYRYVKSGNNYFETSVDYDKYKFNISDFHTHEIVLSIDLEDI